MQERVGDFELEQALSTTLWTARRGDHPVLLRLTQAPRAMDTMLVIWLNESRLAQTIEHPHLGRLLDVGHVDEHVYFAYEHVEQPRLLGLDVTLSEALTIGLKLCAALGELHIAADASGRPLHAAHRGVAPRSIVLGGDGAVRLLDFMAFEQRARDAATRRELFPYLSPEQVRGQPVDARSDQYALASVLWELTVGERRFASTLSELDMLQSIRTGAEPPSARRHRYPRWLEVVIMRALSTEPEARYPSMAAFADALASCAN